MINPITGQHTMSVWGSGLLAVDIVIRSDDKAVFEITAGGTCANVLMGLSKFDWLSKVQGRIGNDEAGKILANALTEARVDISSLVFAEKVETPIIVERFGLGESTEPEHRFEWTCPICNSPVPKYRPTPIPLLRMSGVPVQIPDIFFFDRPTPGNIDLAKHLKSLGAMVMFEPPRLKHDTTFDRAIECSDIVKVSGGHDREFLTSRLSKCPLAVITYGANGLEYRANRFQGVSHDWIALPSMRLARSIDSCGSGDWLTVGFLHALFAVHDLTSGTSQRLGASLKFGQALAALNCLLPGARGLSRVFSRIEISEMVGVTLARGLSSLEGRVIKRATEFGKIRDVRAVCNSCRSQ